MLDRLLELEERDGADLWIIKTKNLIVGKDNAKLVLKELQQAIDISESLKIEMKNGKISKQPLKEIIEKAEKYDNLSKCNDDVFELGERKYWDIKKFGNFFKVETRMEYSKEKCEELIHLIIKAFQMNLSESQNKSLSEENARLRDRLDEFERVGIIKCPICGEVEVTQYGDDEHLPNLTCCNCKYFWLCAGKESDENNLSKEIQNLKEKIDILENNKAHIPELAFRNGKAYCKKCGSDLE